MSEYLNEEDKEWLNDHGYDIATGFEVGCANEEDYD